MKNSLKKLLISLTVRSSAFVVIVGALACGCYAQTDQARAWSALEKGLADKDSSHRLAAVRVLGLVPNDPHAVELAEKSLKDSDTLVRAAAATALGQMHASGANAALKQALNDKQLKVVLAAAHALRLLNDPICYEAYYEIYTGERKNDTGMIAQEMQVMHDPKQVAEMGFEEGIGYVPFASVGWEALQTIMKDRKDGAAAKAALLTALATDPDVRVKKLLVTASQNANWVLRVAALEAIVKRGDPTLLTDVEPRMKDSNRQVRYTAAATIIHLGDVANPHAGAASAAVSPVLLPEDLSEENQ